MIDPPAARAHMVQLATDKIDIADRGRERDKTAQRAKDHRQRVGLQDPAE